MRQRSQFGVSSILIVGVTSDGCSSRKQTHDESKQEAANVSPPGDTTKTFALPTQTGRGAEELQQEPPTQKQNCRQHQRWTKKERWNDGLDARVRIKPKVSTHDRRDSSTGANGGHAGTGIGDDM